MGSNNPANPLNPNVNMRQFRYTIGGSPEQEYIQNLRSRVHTGQAVAETIARNKAAGPISASGRGMPGLGNMSGPGAPSLEERRIMRANWSPQREALSTHSRDIKEAKAGKEGNQFLIAYRQDTHEPTARRKGR